MVELVLFAVWVMIVSYHDFIETRDEMLEGEVRIRQRWATSFNFQLFFVLAISFYYIALSEITCLLACMSPLSHD